MDRFRSLHCHLYPSTPWCVTKKEEVMKYMWYYDSDVDDNDNADHDDNDDDKDDDNGNNGDYDSNDVDDN